VRIGLLGGTGDMGRGLAIRWASKHDIFIGSRQYDKAKSTAKELSNLTKSFYQSEMKGSIDGNINAEIVKESEVVVVTLPSEATIPTLRELKDQFRSDQIIVSVVVPMERRGKLFQVTSFASDGMGTKSAAEVIQAFVGPCPVVSGFHTVPAACLNDMTSIIDIDVFIAGNNAQAIATVSKLAQEIPNIRPLKVGPLENSKWLEALTPLLLNIAILNNLHDPAVRIIPWAPT
jgi:NADPH-dependent F420 reductase